MSDLERFYNSIIGLGDGFWESCSARRDLSCEFLIACENNQIDNIKRMFSADRKAVPDKQHKNSRGWNAFTIACIHRYSELAELLVKIGVQVDCPVKGCFNPLRVACSNGDIHLVKLILTRNKTGINDALLEACSCNRGGAAKILLEHGADINYEHHRRTPLIEASLWGYTDLVKWLLKNGADINRRNETGLTVLLVACMRNRTRHEDFIVALINHNANVNAKTNHGFTALMYCSYDTIISREISEKSTTVARILIENGAKIDEENTHGNTALITAAFKGCTDMCQLLLDNGANLYHQNKKGKNAIQVADDEGWDETCDFLVEWGEKESKATFLCCLYLHEKRRNWNRTRPCKKNLREEAAIHRSFLRHFYFDRNMIGEIFKFI